MSSVPNLHSRRALSTRDLMKWCDRCERILSGTTLRMTSIPGKVKETIFSHAVDTFCTNFPKFESRYILGQVIASVWNILEDRVKYFFEVYKPAISVLDTTVTIGEAEVPVIEEKSALKRGTP